MRLLQQLTNCRSFSAEYSQDAAEEADDGEHGEGGREGGGDDAEGVEERRHHQHGAPAVRVAQRAQQVRGEDAACRTGAGAEVSIPRATAAPVYTGAAIAHSAIASIQEKCHQNNKNIFPAQHDMVWVRRCAAAPQ